MLFVSMLLGLFNKMEYIYKIKIILLNLKNSFIMSQKEDFISQEPAMKALVPTDVRAPNMPVDVATQEAEEQYNIANIYKVNLTAVGVTEDSINLLLTRSNALREAEAQWRTSYNAEQVDVKNWEEQSPLGYALIKELSAAFSFAYREDSRLIAKIREIRKGSGDDDMIQDLLEYAVLGQANPVQLQAINFDMTKLDTATALSESLSILLAKSIGDKKSQHLLKDVRDRSFTIMKDRLDYIRDAGKYVFAEQPEIKKLFTSDYVRKHSSKTSTTNVPDNQDGIKE